MFQQLCIFQVQKGRQETFADHWLRDSQIILHVVDFVFLQGGISFFLVWITACASCFLKPCTFVEEEEEYEFSPPIC